MDAREDHLPTDRNEGRHVPSVCSAAGVFREPVDLDVVIAYIPGLQERGSSRVRVARAPQHPLANGPDVASSDDPMTVPSMAPLLNERRYTLRLGKRYGPDSPRSSIKGTSGTKPGHTTSTRTFWRAVRQLFETQDGTSVVSLTP